MTKNKLEQKIWAYLQRRKEYRELYGFGTDKYRKRSRRLDNKLALWRRSLALREKRIKNLNEINALVEEFTGVSVKGIGRRRGHDIDIAKNLFYKYCLEGGFKIRGCYIADFVGIKWRPAPAERRLIFTRSFKSNPSNRELWHRFKNYVNLAA